LSINNNSILLYKYLNIMWKNASVLSFEFWVFWLSFLSLLRHTDKERSCKTCEISLPKTEEQIFFLHHQVYVLRSPVINFKLIWPLMWCGGVSAQRSIMLIPLSKHNHLWSQSYKSCTMFFTVLFIPHQNMPYR